MFWKIFGKHGLKKPLKKQNAQTVPKHFCKNSHNSKGRPINIEIDDEKEFLRKLCTKFLKSTDTKRHSRYTSKRAVCFGRINRTIRGVLNESVFRKKWCQLDW